MSSKFRLLFAVMLFSLILAGCTSTESEQNTVFCSECLSESTISKYCKNCGVEAKWLVEKPKDDKDSEVEEKKVEAFIESAKDLLKAEKYEEAKLYLSENIISEDGEDIKNKFMTEDQKVMALDMYKTCSKMLEGKIDTSKEEKRDPKEVSKEVKDLSKVEPKEKCFICYKEDLVSNLKNTEDAGLVHTSCYNNVRVCSICKKVKLLPHEDYNGNGICDDKCDKLCIKCFANEANPASGSGMCDSCDWNEQYKNRAACDGCSGNIVDSSLAGTICTECGGEFKLIKTN